MNDARWFAKKHFRRPISFSQMTAGPLRKIQNDCTESGFNDLVSQWN